MNAPGGDGFGSIGVDRYWDAGCNKGLFGVKRRSVLVLLAAILFDKSFYIVKKIITKELLERYEATETTYKEIEIINVPQKKNSAKMKQLYCTLACVSSGVVERR